MRSRPSRKRTHISVRAVSATMDAQVSAVGLCPHLHGQSRDYKVLHQAPRQEGGPAPLVIEVGLQPGPGHFFPPFFRPS